MEVCLWWWCGGAEVGTDDHSELVEQLGGSGQGVGWRVALEFWTGLEQMKQVTAEGGREQCIHSEGSSQGALLHHANGGLCESSGLV